MFSCQGLQVSRLDAAIPARMDPVIVAQLVGAVLNMGAFALLHFEIAPSSAKRYLIPNLLGSIVLVVTAWIERSGASCSWKQPGSSS